MADVQEEIIVIEEADAAGIETAASSKDKSLSEKDTSRTKNKKLLLIVGSIVILLLLAGSSWVLFFNSAQETSSEILTEPMTQKVKNSEDTVMEQSALETMIEKANYLYTNGNQAEALKLYEKIALYSEAISQYNLGVVQLKEGDYNGALENFKYSIDKGKNRCVSAINAAVCCLYLKDKKGFQHYIGIASDSLPQEVNSPMYSYYYALINYYKKNYIEALSAFKHPTTDEYQTTQNKLRAKISSMYESFDDAINALENPLQEEDSFSLGLLYANIGDLTLAKKHLSNAIIQNDKPIQEQLALAFVSMKSGLHDDAAKLLKNTVDTYPTEAYQPYPITVHLKSELFTPEEAQSFYRNNKANDRLSTFQNIFYFAPYKIFNAEQTISYIRKGNANIYIDDITSAKEYLRKSTRASSVDYGIALAIQDALKFRLRSANKQLSELLKSNPQHSILQYNLALTYAQLGNIPKANEHFLRSYHLDANNYLSGIFAVITSELLGKENTKLSSILQDHLNHEPENEEFFLYRTMLDIVKNNFSSASKWLDNSYKERPLYLALDIAIANQLGKKEIASQKALRLTKLQPNDILPHILLINALYQDKPMKAFAYAAHNHLKKQNFHYNDLCFGPKLTREKSIQMAMLTGQLSPLIEQLEYKLTTSANDKVEILSALGEAYFFKQDFEKAYTIYNQLIDTYKIRDEMTLFMGAAASVGANHHENAIALLELSKLKNSTFAESRYALALLQMERENFPGAIIQLSNIGNSGFVSRYFDFKIDTDKLANEPQKYHAL